MLDMPYFMENENWYEFDFLQRRYVLTDEATPEAKESYDKYYAELNKSTMQ